ncbi:HAD family hydrolase [Candidatus Halobonum tyrrellensis]|uniref:Haloacid dehalogenase superfamily protein n=1 Tax=Candidatus Halobonum tyrrellensis G22 TaxID=1324957 RepID=V4H9I5_9EURY|nr:HAD hydrolase-like protein [Candidatus Halobonum tyrrellensis]ESP87340.1 haloacid dehalogenase superfamily protein [Candidatus Halobonum tyrrellensis G22]
MSYEAVVFDTDVLTRRTPIETRRAAVSAAFRAFGADPELAGVDSVLHGSVGRVRTVCDRYGVDPDAFWAKREAYAAATERTAMLDGRKRLYDDVAGAFDRVAGAVGVVSNAPAASVDHLLDVFDLSGRVSAAVGREPTLDGYARCLPETAYLDDALDSLGTRDALFVGDGNADLVAADRAGVDSAFVRRPARVGYELTTEPTYELDSLADLGAVAGTDSDGVDRPEPNRVA